MARQPWSSSFPGRNPGALSTPNSFSKCPARRAQPAPPRGGYLREGICSSVQGNLSKLEVRLRRNLCKRYMPSEVVHERPTGAWRWRDPCRRGRHWLRALCGRCMLYVRQSPWDQQRVKSRGDHDTIPRDPCRRVTLRWQITEQNLHVIPFRESSNPKNHQL